LPLPGVRCRPVAAEQKEGDKLVFRWAFLFRDKAKTISVIDHTQPVTLLKPGDTFKIFLQPVKNTHIYLFLYDAEEDFYLLFPKAFGESTLEEEHYYLPDDTNWYFIKEGEGTEKFYLVVSETRLSEIENLYDEYITLTGGKASPEKIFAAKQKVIERIEYLMKQETVFTGMTELPYPVAGEWRTMLGENEFDAIEVKTERFYAKKIRLTH